MKIEPRLTKAGTLAPSKLPDTQIVAGLLTTRSNMFTEAERLRERLAEIRNDIAAVDRVLGTLGCTTELDEIMPRQKAARLFGTSELMRECLSVIRRADGPMSSRDIARALIERRGGDASDKRYLSDMVKRISKALSKPRADGLVRVKDAYGKALLWEKVR